MFTSTHFVALVAILVFAGSKFVHTQSCNEIKFVKLSNSATCSEEGNFSIPGDCQSYIKCLCLAGEMETYIASCSEGEIFVAGKCLKESEVQSCPQAKCTEQEVFSKPEETYTHHCAKPELTTEGASSTEPPSAAEKSTSQSAASVSLHSLSTMLVAMSILYSSS